MAPSNYWTPAREAIVREMWLAGAQAQAIVDALDAPINPQSVRAKARRMGLPLRAHGGRTARPVADHRHGAVFKSKGIKALQWVDDDLPELPPDADPLAARGCQWPAGDAAIGTYRHCQEPVTVRVDGRASPYCQRHHDRAFRAGTSKKV